MSKIGIESLTVLLQAALGETPKSAPKGIGLKATYELSRWQEVTAIAMDGLQKLA